MAYQTLKNIDIEGLKSAIKEGNVDLLPDEKKFVLSLIARWEKNRVYSKTAQKRYYERHTDLCIKRSTEIHARNRAEDNYKRKLRHIFGENWRDHYEEGAWENDSGNTGVGNTSNLNTKN